MSAPAPVEPLGRLDHVGIIVASLDRTRLFLEEVLGLPATSESTLEGMGAKIAFFEAGGVQLELVEVTDEEVRSERLGDASARIEHLCLRVEKLEEAAELLERRGVDLAGGVGPQAPRTPFQNNGTISLFSRSETSAGVVLQLIERSEEE